MDVQMVWLVALAVTSPMLWFCANATLKELRVLPPAIHASPLIALAREAIGRK
jgi:hypothetical protein